MSIRKRTHQSKRTIVAAALIVAIALGIMTVLFINAVQRQLWQQSITTILESTQQGCNTLQVQLRKEYEAMGTVTLYLKEFASTQEEELDDFLKGYSTVDTGISLYLENGNCYPFSAQRDEKTASQLENHMERNGIIAPHISSVTGVNVFDLYVRVIFQDGIRGYLVKEYEVERIVDFIGRQQGYSEAYRLPDYVPESSGGESSSLGSESGAPVRYDTLFADIARAAVSQGQISTSSIQRNYEVGFNRAGRIMMQLERAGIVGRQEGAKPRDILFHDLPSLEARLQELGVF